MAKSGRSKVKRSFRRAKRQGGVFAAADAARLKRLSAKLQARVGTDAEGDAIMGLPAEEESEPALPLPDSTGDVPMEVTEKPTEKRISTSGPRGSRREEWRKAKGLKTRGRGIMTGQHASRNAGKTKRAR